MKIAVPTSDGMNVSEHFGRASGFLVFEITDGRVAKLELRTNSGCHTHESGNCGDHSHGAGQHSHAGIVGSIAGCDKVIAAGMGWRAAEALREAGIEPVIAACSGSAEDIVASYLAETLPAQDGFCRCSH
jgi:predicted Fe-Mo cluster-binding NifX family protein